jgi:hypothetical protein
MRPCLGSFLEDDELRGLLLDAIAVARQLAALVRHLLPEAYTRPLVSSL